MFGLHRHNGYPSARSLGFKFPLTEEQGVELRLAKRTWTDEQIDRRGRNGFAIIRSAEIARISFAGVPVEDLPRPAMPDFEDIPPTT